MDAKLMIELFGYLGSFLVLVSFLMVSVVKLRIVNTVGSVIFMIYALIIHSYPTAIMNFCLVLINLRFLWKMSRDEKAYDLVHVKKDDEFLGFTLSRYREDIEACFPGISLSLEDMNAGYLICAQGRPVGITLGKVTGDTLDMQLDYSIPEYRDFSIGKFLLSKFPQEGIRKLVYNGPAEHHHAYLDRMGFVKTDAGYERVL